MSKICLPSLASDLSSLEEEPVKIKRPQQQVMKPRKPVIEETPENRNKPSPPAAVASTTLSGESHQIAAAANSDKTVVIRSAFDVANAVSKPLAKPLFP